MPSEFPEAKLRCDNGTALSEMAASHCIAKRPAVFWEAGERAIPGNCMDTVREPFSKRCRTIPKIKEASKLIKHPRRLILAGLAIAFIYCLIPSSSIFPASPQAPAKQTEASAVPWWKHALIYEIYPRSFQDSNGDGIGDLKGITERLGYLQGLGVNAIWLSPIYPSPQVDFGYDISNYEAIDPMYGSMADFDHLMAEARQHHIRVLMDMVLNHTSDKHPWFIESSSSRSNPKSDWYVWNSGKPANAPGVTPYQKKFEHDGMVPPNNWESVFGGSAWQWVPQRKQFYYHKFYVQQPDLNWRNPEVRKAMYDVCRFWLDKGVAGFRLDAVETLFEDAKLRNEKILPGTNPYGDPHETWTLTSDLPEIHDVMRQLRKIVDSYPGNRVLVGETYTRTTHDLLSMYGLDGPELQLPMDTQVGFINQLNVGDFRQKIYDAENDLDGHTPLLVFDNHDNRRSWDRYGDGQHNEAISKILATVLLTTRSVALMYYGEEIGMVTTPPKTRAEVQDPIGKLAWPKFKGRDGERTPMQWNTGKNAGFSTADHTWLPVPPNYHTVNVETESQQPGSMLNWYKTLIALRAGNPALRDGPNIMVNGTDPNVLSYLRKNPHGGPSVLVAMNFTAQPRTVSYDLKGQGIEGATGQALAEDGGVSKTVNLDHVTLPPFAVLVAEVQ
jgi:alpha-glucosidase